jgi:hypothetical protein
LLKPLSSDGEENVFGEPSRPKYQTIQQQLTRRIEMKTTKLFCAVAIATAVFCVVRVPGASAQILSNKWFSLKFLAKGSMVDSNGVPTKATFSVPVFMQFIGTGTNATFDSYTMHVWTETDAGWTNIVTTSEDTVSTNNDTYFSDYSLTVHGLHGDSVHTYHTPNLIIKTDKTGGFKSATYSTSGAEVNTGTIIIAGATNTFYGSCTFKGSTVTTNKLPFVAP